MNCSIIKLNKKFELQEKQTLPDTMGGEYVQWVKKKDVWLNIVKVSDSVAYQLSRLNKTTTHKAYSRYDSTITDEMRFVRNEEIYMITSVNNIGERNKYIEFKLVKGGNYEDSGV